jgi:phosphoglycolate phosphatase
VRVSGVTDKPGITLVCCGLVGTLVTDDGLIERSFAEAIATQGVVSGTSAFARRMAQVHQARGQAPSDLLSTLFPDNEARAQAAQLAFERALTDAIRRAEVRPVAGAHQVLDQLGAAGRRICVMTSLPRRALDMVLDSAGLRRRIDLALCVEDVRKGFPAPDLILTAVMRTGTGAVQEVAVVHGTGAGLEGGRRSGASIVAGVLTGPHPAARLRAAGATHVLNAVSDLPGLVLAGDGPGPDSSAAGDYGLGHTLFAPPGPAAADQANISIPPQVPLERRTSGL